jgi:hypothetical protein
MTKRKRWLVGLLLITCLGAVAIVYFLMPPRSPINQGNYTTLRLGMTLQEVESVLGGPARDESTGVLVTYVGDEAFKFIPAMLGGMTMSSAYRTRVWATDYAIIRLTLDHQMRVDSLEYMDVHPADNPLVAYVCRWLRL